jgi:Mg2+ and Co2+ transporter CorA
VYHSLDVETGNAFWIILKGDELIKERIEDSFEYSGGLGKLEGERQQRNALSESLATHLIICDWCGEDWRWYISYLEESLQEKTRQTLAVVVDAPLNPTPEKPSKAVTWSSVSSAYAEKKSMRSSKVCKSEKGLQEPPLRAQSDPLAPQPRGQSTHLNTIYSQNGSMNPTKFKFADLQQIQLVEDRANEVLLILESNTSVLADLKAHYESIFQSQHCPLELVRDCKRDIERFNLRVGSVINDLQMQRARTTTLLRMIADRKSLVSCTMFYLLGLISNDSKLYGILDFQSMEASKILALKAQESTENMEVMTKDMHILAQKTKQETVSMRIITLVTLFFLPGTFISVSLLAVTLHFSSVSSLPISCTPGHQS